MSDRMWAVDVEGSGKFPPEIVELALLQLDGLRMTGRTLHWRFRPRNGISPIATRIHGIREEDVADEPDFVDVADDLLLLMEHAPIVGHNVRVELDLLGREMPEWQPAAAIDTLRLARRFLPGHGKHGLEHLGKALGLTEVAVDAVGGTSHSAVHDAALCALLLSHLLEPLSERERAAALRHADILADAQGAFL